MEKSNNDKLKSCPFCKRKVDPLRAAAVSILDGQMVYFCSVVCRETFLDRDSLSESSRDDKSGLPAGDASFNDVNATPSSPGHADVYTQDTDSVSDVHRDLAPLGTTGKARQHVSSPPALWHLIWPHLLDAAVAGVLLTVVVLFNYLKMPVISKAAAVGSAVLFTLIFGIWRERKNGASAILDIVAIPISAVLCASAAFFSSAFLHAWETALLLLLLRGVGRSGEAIIRHRTGIAAFFLDSAKSMQNANWRDNSDLAIRIRRITMVADWGRIPLALLSGIGLFVWTGAEIASALLTASILILVWDSRLLRMVTADAHLLVALFVRQLGGSVRDASAVERCAEAACAVMTVKGVLAGSDVTVVGWNSMEGISRERIFSALFAVESAVPNAYGRAIAAYCRQQGSNIDEATHPEISPGKGVWGDTSQGLLHCGSRMFMLENSISTGEFDALAHDMEQSGRRALFVSLNRSLVALMGIDEKVHPAIEVSIQKMSLMGVSPVLVTSADVDSAQNLGRRMGIEQVIFEKSERYFEEVLEALKNSGEKVLFLGGGDAFEENVRHASCAIALGAGKTERPSLADFDMRGLTLPNVVSVLERARAARRSVRVNLFCTLLLACLGSIFAVGWNSVEMVVGLAVASVLISMGCTLSGPYPAIVRLRTTVHRVGKAIVQRVVGIGRAGRA